MSGQYKVEGTTVRLPNAAGGFDVRDCPDAVALARRIVACLNACVDVPTEDLESPPSITEYISDQADGAVEQRDELATAVLAYDGAIRECANDPDKMASFCSATGDDLDALYAAMIDKAAAAKVKP